MKAILAVIIIFVALCLSAGDMNCDTQCYGDCCYKHCCVSGYDYNGNYVHECTTCTTCCYGSGAYQTCDTNCY